MLTREANYYCQYFDVYNVGQLKVKMANGKRRSSKYNEITYDIIFSFSCLKLLNCCQRDLRKKCFKEICYIKEITGDYSVESGNVRDRSWELMLAEMWGKATDQLPTSLSFLLYILPNVYLYLYASLAGRPGYLHRQIAIQILIYDINM